MINTEVFNIYVSLLISLSSGYYFKNKKDEKELYILASYKVAVFLRGELQNVPW